MRVFDWLPQWLPDSIPIFGYGLMLFCAFIACAFLANWLARQGIHKFTSRISPFGCSRQDYRRRIWFMIQYKMPIEQFLPDLERRPRVYLDRSSAERSATLLAYFRIIAGMVY